MPTLEIKAVIDETPTVKTFIFEKPSDFSFMPGQFCWISLPEYPKLGRSPMAIASGMKESELKFSIRSWGNLTKKLFEYQAGDTIEISEPEGTWFPLERAEGRPIYGIARGTGITPIRSILYSITQEKTRMKIFYEAKRPHSFLYKYELPKWDAELVVEEPDSSWSGKAGQIIDLLKEAKLDVAKGICHVCGPTSMMASVVKVLKELGFAADRIYVSLERMVKGRVIGPVYPVSNPIVGF